MPFASKLQQFVEQIARKYEVDLTQVGGYVCIALPSSSDYLLLHRPDIEHLYLARVVEGGDTYFIPDPDVLVYTTPEGWIPVEILFSAAEWQQFLRTQSVKIGAQEQNGPNTNMIDFADTWAQRLLEEGWLAHGEKVDRPTERIVGCQSTNHTECYGELWQCSAYHKTVCYAEGATITILSFAMIVGQSDMHPCNHLRQTRKPTSLIKVSCLHATAQKRTAAPGWS